MAKFVAQPNVGENDIVTYKIVDAGITDADVNKPVKVSAADSVALCSDGDQIYGFINSVERHTADGKVVVGVQIGGRRKVTLDGASAVGTIVEAAANTAAGTALGANWGLCAVHTKVAATVKCWLVISGTGLDEADVLVEKQ